ncbi:MAG TPA: BamA/TamA family outer membrane protein [Casimicrobiaceae bacterium]|nr:BamA/TamA family outer membrane protein [Casimicrobiaceae bacterium]
MLRSFLLLVFTSLTFAATANAQDATDKSSIASGDVIRYRLVVAGPDPVASAVREGLDLARWQNDSEMTLELLELLARDAVAQAKEIAAIEGFYDASVDVSIDRDARPFVVTVRVTPGSPVRVSSVNIDVSGAATSDVPLGTAAIREARAGWRLDLGEVFRQSAWVDAKEQALRALRRGPYAAARIAKSRAEVNPQQGTADLDVEIESGPRFAIGPLDVTGLTRYERSVVENFNILNRGEPYTESALDAYVRRLAASGYFASVQASIDTTAVDPNDATVRVAVVEAPTHRFEGALSYSTDTEFGARATYTNVNVDARALQMRIEGRFELKQQLARVTFTWPPTLSKWLDSASIGAQRTEFQNNEETTAAIDFTRRGVDERAHPVFRAALLYDKQVPAGATASSARAAYLETGYVLRRVDDLLSPTRGFMIDARIGGGVPGLSTEGFGRLFVQTATYVPFDRLTQLVLRAEAGAVLSSTREGVPSVLLFRTGGDTTVRGYEYQSLGVRLGDATVAGRYYALASAEVVRWLTDIWGIAVFVDAGNAADTLSDLSPALGYGIGARLRTPIGPFRLDVAYGDDVQKWRLHFSVGLAF